ncbi:MAG: hypothetical protein MZV63_30815 [Marinilabiliales bacterium]|nr:hypothetical protein [Marinilabiliales bacterium]
MATYGSGIARWMNGRFVTIDSSAGLFDDSIYQMVEDGDGRSFMGTNVIFHTMRDELVAYSENRISGVISAAYGRRIDGMESPECNGGYQPCGRPGFGWRCSGFPHAGTGSHRSREDRRKSQCLTFLFHWNRWKSMGEMVETFSQLQFLNPKPTRSTGTGVPPFFPLRIGSASRCRLTGFDPNWVNAGTRREAFYTNLPAGEYHFEVTAEIDGIVSKQKLTIPMKKKPHLLEMLWMRILLALFGVFLLGLIFHLRNHNHGKNLRAQKTALVDLVETRTWPIYWRKTEELTAEAKQTRRGAPSHSRPSEWTSSNLLTPVKISETTKVTGYQRGGAGSSTIPTPNSPTVSVPNAHESSTPTYRIGF